MLFDQVFTRFVKGSPLSVMLQGILENIFHPDPINELFERTAEQQYTRELLFSTVVDTMTLVACGVYKTPHAVYQDHQDWFPVSVTSLYNKLQGVEPNVAAELVRSTASQLGRVIHALGGALPALLPGYTVKILDGNALAGTDHRLQESRHTSAALLPGKSLVVLDPALMLAVDVFPCEDGHAQERSLLPAVLQTVQAGEAWIEDRNFCTSGFLFGIDNKRPTSWCVNTRACPGMLSGNCITSDARRLARSLSRRCGWRMAVATSCSCVVSWCIWTNRQGTARQRSRC